MQNDPGKGASLQPDAQKTAYICSVKKKLADRRTVLELVKRKVGRAVASRRIVRSDQLTNAERRADSCVSVVESCIEHLSSTSESKWDDSRFKTDIALDELSTSVKQMVARFT